MVELEQRLSTERVLDVFTVQPKVGIVTYLIAERLSKHSTLTDFFSQPNEPSWFFVYQSFWVFS